MEEFLAFIRNYIELSLEAEATIRSVGKEISKKKGELIAEEGKTSKHMYFLASGVARTYLYLNGKDITHWISLEDSLITSWYSYVQEKPASEYVELTEDSRLVQISKQDWEILYQQHPELERFSRLILEQEMSVIDEFYKGYYFLTAKQKYELLISAAPQIIQRANLGHIASMLGITQETLSRIRGK
ncbi:Crp/Fnr family transcriptional regulator [Pseudotenacibaculum haliotis]|uniref:Crp/Fnr family transcriptional regulator n=1 Tax=Pseudotenacibaculum haliotis TaxID=1862138 RepID=A0ABW5LSN3_9FLAO